MKFTKIALAVAATLVTGQAFAAVTLAQIDTARNSGNIQETWLSGASAPTYNVFLGFAKTCDAGTTAVFNAGTTSTAEKPGASAASNFLAYACERGGVVSVVYHTIAGGSFNAFAPHVPNNVETNGAGPLVTANLKRLKKLSAVGTTCASAGTLSTGEPVFSKCATVTPATSPDGVVALPAGGFSDVEAALFGVDAAPYGTQAEANVGQVFGVAVSTNLYRKLQQVQGLADVNATTFDPAQAPNITSAQYTSIITGAYATDWAPILGAANGAGKKIVLARRVPTSGTQASSNAFFLKNPCNGDPSIGGTLLPANASDSTATFVVTENSSTGGVKTALKDANTAGDYAIGVVSLENKPGSSDEYHYVKLDGVHPEAGDVANARTTAALGQYPFHIEMKSFTANTADSFGATVIGEIATQLGDPSTCTDLPRGLTLSPTGANSAGCATGTFVSKVSRFGNNCQALQFLF